MKKHTATFIVTDCKTFKIKMLNWSSRFNIFCFLDNNNYNSPDNSFDCLLAAGTESTFVINKKEDFSKLEIFSRKQNDWLFGHFGYELFNEESVIKKENDKSVDFGKGFFFSAKIILRLKSDQLIIESDSDEPRDIIDEIYAQEAIIKNNAEGSVVVKAESTREAYLENIGILKKHIHRGDCYEINFCRHFYAEDANIDPLFIYQQLTEFSPNPFGAFYKLQDKYCICASPERFLKKTGVKLISQPIKGTAKRYLSDTAADNSSKQELRNSEKEKSENVMVVDLVRNDLSKVCAEGSVKVPELFGIYSFPQVHQMISSIEGNLRDDLSWTDAIAACFPMGSMTGAPKIKVMELIEKYEISPRGLFSGSIGYVTPELDFDFNVVIRSLMYDEKKKLISFKAGGGITFKSDAEKEYEECMLKAAAIIKILEDNI